MPSGWTIAIPPPPLKWDDIKGDVSIETVAVSLLGEPPGRDGRGLWWTCPFHDDRNPSFHVDPDRGRWKCFGCGERGDAPALARKLEGLSFPDAVRRVAELCGRTDPTGDFQPAERPKPAKVAARPKAGASGLSAGDASAVVEDAARRLWTPGGAGSLAYLRGRGLDDRTIREARLGFVHRLVVPKRDGGSFHVTGVSIPWFDAGRVARINVRLTPPWMNAKGKETRYVDVHRDGPTVYPSIEAIRPGLPLVACEGEFDALLLAQVIGDFARVVTLGSAGSTPDDDAMTAVLRAARACPRRFIAHDADDAGDEAAAKWLRLDRTTRVRPPAPANDWTDAHRLGFNVVRNLWLGVVRDAPRPSWEALEAERWGSADAPDDLGAAADGDGTGGGNAR